MEGYAVALAAVLVLVALGALGRGLWSRGCGCGPGCDCGRRNSPWPIRLRLRELWQEHVDRTRAFVTSAVHGLPDGKATSDYLVANQGDIGALFGETFGAEAGAEVTRLLTGHILIAAELVAALKAGQPALEIRQRWEQNADEIGAALAQLRPAWGDAGPMLRVHLAETAAYTQAHLDGDYAKELQLLDTAREHMAQFADFLAAGWNP